MNHPNYQRELEKILDRLQRPAQAEGNGRSGESDGTGESAPPRLFLHSCCAPCSSYCLEYLCPFFDITAFYYNPNISAAEEYRRRVEEQKRLIAAYNEEKKGRPIGIVEGDYRPEDFFEAVRGYERCPEGGERCGLCFALRLGETARLAAEGGYDYFGTTLTISPLKNAPQINEIGQQLSVEYGVAWLPSDFKKRDGYKRSIELSEEYHLYRQNYCGCVFSQTERDSRNCH